jgi:hypothetical protein
LFLGILNTASRSVKITGKSALFEPPFLFNNLHEETFRYQMAIVSNRFIVTAPSFLLIILY